MCHSWIKLIMGLWLILSGLVSPLVSPINMIIIGFIAGVCCFRSYKLWQAFATGILGLWLFMCGLSFTYMYTHLVTPVNFIIVGTLIALLGLHCILFPYKRLTTKTA